MTLAFIGFLVLLTLAICLTVASVAIILAAANGFMVGAGEVLLVVTVATLTWLGVWLTWPFTVTVSLAS